MSDSMITDDLGVIVTFLTDEIAAATTELDEARREQQRLEQQLDAQIQSHVTTLLPEVTKPLITDLIDRVPSVAADPSLSRHVLAIANFKPGFFQSFFHSAESLEKRLCDKYRDTLPRALERHLRYQKRRPEFMADVDETERELSRTKDLAAKTSERLSELKQQKSSVVSAHAQARINPDRPMPTEAREQVSHFASRIRTHRESAALPEALRPQFAASPSAPGATIVQQSNPLADMLHMHLLMKALSPTPSHSDRNVDRDRAHDTRQRRRDEEDESIVSMPRAAKRPAEHDGGEVVDEGTEAASTAQTAKATVPASDPDIVDEDRPESDKVERTAYTPPQDVVEEDRPQSDRTTYARYEPRSRDVEDEVEERPAREREQVATYTPPSRREEVEEERPSRSYEQASYTPPARDPEPDVVEETSYDSGSDSSSGSDD